MKLAISSLIEKIDQAIPDLRRRIVEVDSLIEQYDPFSLAAEIDLEVSEAIAARDFERMHKAARKLEDVREKPYELSRKRSTLAAIIQDFSKTRAALALAVGGEVNYNPNKHAQNSESRTYADILNYTLGVVEHALEPSSDDEW
jgi:hypothetical protein